MNSRVEKAAALFQEGYNCSQSVFAAYSDLYGIDTETALKISASFGGGMGRMREVCGAVSGMFLVAGLETGTTDAKNVQGKKANYDMVQRLAEEFKKNTGSIICKELLGLVEKKSSNQVKAAEFKDTQPEARTSEYYKKRPCAQLVRDAAEIIENVLLKEKE